MPGRIKLTIVTGAQQGKEFVFNEHDTFLFGRMEDCHVCLPEDTGVSRHHFMLEINPPDARLCDLGSKNGTYVNNKKHGGRERHETPAQGTRRQYPQVDLHNGDEIRVGETILHIHVELPVMCSECGVSLSGEFFEQSKPPSRTCLCVECQQKLADLEKTRVVEGYRKPRRLPVAHCQQCGKDVSAEIDPIQHGDYVCESCRKNVQANPIDLMINLFQQNYQQTQSQLNIPDYLIEKKLGEGGMGVVYLVKHRGKDTLAALKVMLSKVAVDENNRKLFMREVEVTRALRHKNIVEFLSCGYTGSIFYFLLEFCEGGNVKDLMKRRGGKISLMEAGPIILQALEGLAFAHQKDIVHRDLKPQNILLAGKEGKWIAKVADLGLAKDFTKAGYSGMTVTGSFMGALNFTPREQLTNFKYNKPASDIWSIGATFYNMLTGHYPRDCPHEQDPVEIILRGEIVPIRKRDSGIPKRVADVIDRSLINRISERYQHAGEMRDALEQAL